MKLVVLLFTFYFTHTAAIRICSFNIQSFGEAKCAKPEVMAIIVKIVSRCDIMLLMEIKDSTDKVMNKLMEKLNSQPEMKDEFSLIISQRLGRKTYKEQYAFIYRKQLVGVKAEYQYLDHQDGDIDAFSREPFIVWFQTYKRDFVIIPQHTAPEAAVREIDELYDVYLDVKHKWKTEDLAFTHFQFSAPVKEQKIGIDREDRLNFIFMGDFNAACSYVPKKHWKKIRLRTNQEFVWLIEDNVDTTVKSSTRCAYDRIVLHGQRLINSVVSDSATVFDFMQAYGLTEAEALEISDHYPVEFQLSSKRQMKPSYTSN